MKVGSLKQAISAYDRTSNKIGQNYLLSQVYRQVRVDSYTRGSVL